MQMKPLVTRLRTGGTSPWPAVTEHAVKSFPTMPEAFTYALAQVTEPTC